MNNEYISEEEFDKRFTIFEKNGEEQHFETYGKDIEDIQKIFKTTPNKVWTMIECEDKLFYQSGFHKVNRLYYFVTLEEVPENTLIEVEIETK